MKRTEMKRSGPIQRKAAPDATQKRRTRKCALKSCRAEFEPRSMTHKACGPSCALEIGRLEEVRKDRKVLMEFRERNKKKSAHVKEAQKAFNAWVRLRDDALPCICCGEFSDKSDGIGGAWDAGHYLSRGSHPHLRFDERNVFKQRKGCNRPGGATAASFRIGVIARIGLPAVEALEADNTARHYTIDYLKAIKLHYQQKLKELKKGI